MSKDTLGTACADTFHFPVRPTGVRSMKKLFLIVTAFTVAMPAQAATSSTDLETLAQKLEQSPASITLDKALLTALREPAKTLDGVTLPTTAAKYTTTVETAWKLKPAGWDPALWSRPSPPNGPACTAMQSYWGPDGGLKTQVYAWGVGTCAAVTSASIARAWAWKLKQVGR